MVETYGPKYWAVNVNTNAARNFQCILDMSKAKTEGTATIRLAGKTEDQLITVASLNLRHPSNTHGIEGQQFRAWVLKNIRVLSRFLRAARDANDAALTIYPGTTDPRLLEQLAPVADFEDQRKNNSGVIKKKSRAASRKAK